MIDIFVFLAVLSLILAVIGFTYCALGLMNIQLKALKLKLAGEKLI